MSIFNLTDEKMKETSSTFTAHEIYQQPATWRKTCAQLAGCKDELQAFIDQVVKQDDFDIILVGAGTSEFVGNSLFQALNPKYNYNVEAAEVVCQNLYHLFVTCNHEGTLSKMAASRKNCFAINLTPETHDQSFAMTSSYSNMYLATYLALNLDKLDEITAEVEKLCVAGQHFLDDQFGEVQKIVDEFDYNRIVYLGNIGLKGVAQESALKTLELTAGKVATMYDSELGFRHGPKSIIDDNTLTIAYLSDDEYRRRYELDLVKEMAHQRKGNKIAVVYNHDCEGIEELADYPIQIKIGQDMENVLLGLDFILFAQTIALMKSLSLGITPDNPCPTGEVNRVVKGVTLYPYTLK